MKYLLILSLGLLVPLETRAQSESIPLLQPCFFAIITSDVDTMINWYTRQLGFEVMTSVHLEDRGIKQANLSREGIQLELIETNTVISMETALADLPPKTRLTGFFKFGFAVSDLDAWVKRLTTQGVALHGRIVNDPVSGKRTVLVKDPDGNRIQLFEK